MEKQSNIEITALTEIGGRDLDHEMKEYSEQFTQNTWIGVLRMTAINSGIEVDLLQEV